MSLSTSVVVGLGMIRLVFLIEIRPVVEGRPKRREAIKFLGWERAWEGSHALSSANLLRCWATKSSGVSHSERESGNGLVQRFGGG